MTPPVPSAVTPEQFRLLLGRFATGVTVLTTGDATHRPHGMTVTAFSSVSLDPPLVLACVDRAASMLSVLDAASHFAVNVLAAHQEDLSRRFAIEEMELRFDGVEWSKGAGGAPVLRESHASIECRRHSRIEAGDHVIFVGEVVGGRVDPDTRPLVYHTGTYGRVAP